MTAVEAISDAERAELKENFDLFDRDNDGYLTIRELGEAMRAMGQHPTEKDVIDLVRKPSKKEKQAEQQTEQQEQQEQSEEDKPEQEKQEQEQEEKQQQTGNELTDFDAFQNIMAKRLNVQEPDDELLEAFRVFDKEGTGVMSAADLRQIMSTLGETLGGEELEEFIKDADDDGDGQVNIQDFTNLLISS